MALSSSPAKGFDRDGGGPRRLWRLAMRVVAAVTALIAVGCTAWMLYQLRRWKIKHPEGDYQADEFILAWLVLTLALSALASITAILTSTLSRSKPPIVPPTVTLATDVLLALSLLASGVWLTLAATTTIDGNTALNIDFLTPSADITVKSAVEIVGIGLTFTTATLHLLTTLLLLPNRKDSKKKRTISPPQSKTKWANRYHPDNDDDDDDDDHYHHFTSSSTSKSSPLLHPLPLHPAYRPPLPFPNPHHPTCAYPNRPPPSAPVLQQQQQQQQQRYQWRSNPGGGGHACERSSSLSMQCIGEGVSTEVLDGKARVC